jgi:hypothetical protein
MPCEQKLDRVDVSDRARAGSQRQLQTYVNYRQSEFSQKVFASLDPSPGPGAELHWVRRSREITSTSTETQNSSINWVLKGYSARLKEFWPERGPCWDAFATVEGIDPPGVVLVEAKSHASELLATCKAKSAASRARIEASLARTKQRLGVDLQGDWMRCCYQAANRYAHLVFLRDLGVLAWLVNVYFLNDKHFADAPRAEEKWQVALKDLREEMVSRVGLCLLSQSCFLKLQTSDDDRGVPGA